MENSETNSFDFDEVDHLLRNAELRDQIEPYVDEAICRVNVQAFSTAKENEFLESMLAWERAPVLPPGLIHLYLSLALTTLQWT